MSTGVTCSFPTRVKDPQEGSLKPPAGGKQVGLSTHPTHPSLTLSRRQHFSSYHSLGKEGGKGLAFALVRSVTLKL